MENKTEIRYASSADIKFWFSLDRHLSTAEFHKKVRDRQGYVLFFGNKPAGVLRYNLFWDNTPFCTLLYVAESERGKGCGKALMQHWEADMKARGYRFLLTSTQIDEDAQHFYRKLGYRDCGNLNVPDQPTELFLSKYL